MPGTMPPGGQTLVKGTDDPHLRPGCIAGGTPFPGYRNRRSILLPHKKEGEFVKKGTEISIGIEDLLHYRCSYGSIRHLEFTFRAVFTLVIISLQWYYHIPGQYGFSRVKSW